MPSWLTNIVMLISGGAFGAVLTELWRRRRGRTRKIPLIELVNRNPLLYELKGIKMVKDAEPQAAPVEVTAIRNYEMLLKNTSDLHLQDLHIQFQFMGAEDIKSWVSSPVKSSTDLLMGAVYR